VGSAATGLRIRIDSMDAPVSCVCALEDDRVVAASVKKISCWIIGKKAPRVVKEFELPSEVQVLAALPPGRLLTGDVAGELKIWNASTWGEERTLSGHEQKVTCVAVSQTGRLLASGSEDGTVRLWRIKDELRTPSNGPIELVHFEVQLPSGVILNTIVPNNSLVEAVKEKVSEQAQAHPVNQQRLVWNGLQLQSHKRLSEYGIMTGDTILVEKQDEDPASKEELLDEIGCELTLRMTAGRAVSAACFVSERCVATGAQQDAAVRLWDCATGECVQVLEGCRGHAVSLLCVSEGLLASCGSDRYLQLWSLERGTCIKVLRGDARCMVLSTVANCVVACNRSADLTLWQVEELCREDALLAEPLVQEAHTAEPESPPSAGDPTPRQLVQDVDDNDDNWYTQPETYRKRSVSPSHSVSPVQNV